MELPQKYNWRRIKIFNSKNNNYEQSNWWLCREICTQLTVNIILAAQTIEGS